MNLWSDSRNGSAHSRGTTPQGKGREGIRKGKERNATAIWSVVEGGQDSSHLKSLTGQPDAMPRGIR